ncbi:MAG: hypothetical protein ACXIUP_12540 [Microcella sp.]
MSHADLTALARTLDDALAALDGVIAVYSPDPAVARAARELMAGGEAPARTRVVTDDERLVVRAAIGVDARTAAPGIARAAARTIRELAGGDAEVSVSVRRVASIPPALESLT